MIIEEAIVARLVAAFPELPIYAVDWPEAKPAPCIVYRQVDAASDPEHYATTHADTFELLIVADQGRDTQRYRQAKVMASDVGAAFGTHFTIVEPELFCVANIVQGSQSDQYDAQLQQHWVEARYTFTYYTED